MDGHLWHKPESITASPPGHPEHAYHSFVAGAIGGFFVWGRFSAVNNQLLLYLTSRVLVGLWKRAYHGQSHPRAYQFASAAIWGLVMALWEESPHVLHPSLKSSMDEIYRYSFGSSFGADAEGSLPVTTAATTAPTTMPPVLGIR